MTKYELEGAFSKCEEKLSRWLLPAPFGGRKTVPIKIKQKLKRFNCQEGTHWVIETDLSR